jgi:hypothetical protein
VLSPQHFTSPELSAAQVAFDPADIADTPVVNPETFTGVVRSVVVPSPMWPVPLYPQHFIPPVLSNAHAWLLPVAIAVTPELNPLTVTGALW